MTTDVVEAACVPTPTADPPRHTFAALRAMARRALRFRFRCLIMGHDDSFAREPRRLMLRCETCGRETTGWAIGGGGPVVTAPRRVSPGRKAALDTTVRIGPWARRREGRAEARDRQRRRLVAAASRLGG